MTSHIDLPAQVVHVVLIAWTPPASSGLRENARTLARSFPTTIPGVISVVEGPSVSPEGIEGPFNYGMVITFMDEHARDAYLPHPVHQEFVALLQNGAISQVVAFDMSGPLRLAVASI